MKARSLLVAAVIFGGPSAAAFAQANFNTGSVPVTAVVKSGHTEKAGDITFMQTSGTSVAGTLNVSYGVPITIPFANVDVIGTGGYSGVVSMNIASSSNAAGILVVNVPGGVVAGTIRVFGVRVGISGTVLTSVSAILFATGNTITAGQTNAVVISSFAPGITAVTVSPSSGIQINASSGTVINSPGTVRVTEGFLNAFGMYPFFFPIETNSTLVRLTLSAAPPAGVTITFEGFSDTEHNSVGAISVPDAFATASCSTGAINGAPVSFTSASTTLTVCYGITWAGSNPDPTVLERLAIDVTASVSASALPLSAATLQVTATFAPIGTAFGAGGAVISTPIPRYAAVEVGPVTLVTVTVTAPQLNITMSKGSYVNGEVVTATGFRIENLSSTVAKIELAVWLKLPGIAPISIINLGADSSFALTPGFSQELGPLTFLTVDASFPRGSYSLNSRLVHPVTKKFVNQDLNTFQIQ